jgi:heme exporter protein A
MPLRQSALRNEYRQLIETPERTNTEMNLAHEAGSSVAPVSTRGRTASLEARELSFARAGQLVLDTINLRIEASEIVAVLGANGAGKTTLLRCLAALCAPCSGNVLWLGQSLKRNVRLRRLIGLVAHQDWVYSELTPRENLQFYAGMFGVANPQARIEQLLSEAELMRHADHATQRLSHGMRRRLSICRALLHDPPILLLDEPFSGLDEFGQRWLRQLIAQQSARSSAILFTTHERALAGDLADHVLFLKGGKLYPLADAAQRNRSSEHAA